MRDCLKSLRIGIYLSDSLEKHERFMRLAIEQARPGNQMPGAGESGKQALLLFRHRGSLGPTDTPNGRIPPPDGQGMHHLAFAISAQGVARWRERLRAISVFIESEVHCGAQSIYFRDPDGHLVELITPGCWSIY